MMKIKGAALAVLFLVLVLAFPSAVLARPMDGVDRRVEDGVVFVPLRQAAEAFGWRVQWQSETRQIHLFCPVGLLTVLSLRDISERAGGFVEAGVTWIPYEVALMTFAPPPPDIEIVTFTLTQEARDIALYDFDYLVAFVLENSPWDSVIYRVLGIDFMEYVRHAREAIENKEPIHLFVFDEDIFWSQVPRHEGDDPRSLAASYLFALLAVDFAPGLQGIGHLQPRTLDWYSAQLTGFAREYYHHDPRWGYNYWVAHLLEAFSHPAARWFYGEVDVDLYEAAHPLPAVPGNVQTEILVPGEVAYLRINSFMVDTSYDNRIILPFLRQVRDFDHLIIDLRGNWGGLMYYFPALVLRRLINEPVVLGSHEFFSGGSAAAAKMDAMVRTTLPRVGQPSEQEEILYIEILPAGEFIAQRGMTHVDAGDLARLDYVMVSRSVFTPARDAVGFGGKVWILVDGQSASKTAQVAQMAHYTGFATVVGENTSNIMGSAHVYIPLPNTGIVWRTDIGYQTDTQGRSLEVYGIAPHIRNFEGMDALETVRALIAGEE
ncbi:MAG: S41 family peptidase [Defluviitaleaceae bacterium]|nr:S41 family peptidase [Defluviitaleaceae bacterium]MCL2240660.1 S41 family peptidase [Defluviitaleaceae bacterium]